MIARRQFPHHLIRERCSHFKRGTRASRRINMLGYFSCSDSRYLFKFAIRNCTCSSCP